MYAVIETGGKQYKVANGDVVYVEKLDAENESTVDFKVVAVSTDDGFKAGTPYVEGAKVTAPLPGTITEVKVAVGQAVKAGETVIILEAMKMQNNIEAETSGTVTSVLVGQGDAVMEGATLITIG